MIDWWKKVVFNNYVNFTGRARRAEYWNFVLVKLLIPIAILVLLGFISLLISLFNKDAGIMTFFGGAFTLYFLIIIYQLIFLLPHLSVTVRRLHDINKSGWYYFIFLIPLVGIILLIVWLATEGDSGKNNYGDNPKSQRNEINEIGR